MLPHCAASALVPRQTSRANAVSPAFVAFLLWLIRNSLRAVWLGKNCRRDCGVNRPSFVAAWLRISTHCSLCRRSCPPAPASSDRCRRSAIGIAKDRCPGPTAISMVRLYSSAPLSPRAHSSPSLASIGLRPTRERSRSGSGDAGTVSSHRRSPDSRRCRTLGRARLRGEWRALDTQGDQVGRGTNKAAFAHFDRGPTRCLRKAFQDGFADDYSNRGWKAHDTFRIESGLIINFGLHPELFLQAPDRNFVHLQLRCISAVRLSFSIPESLGVFVKSVNRRGRIRPTITPTLLGKVNGG